LSASYLRSEVFLDELDGFLLRNVMMLPDLRGTYRATSQPIPWPLESYVDGGAEDAQLWNVPSTRYFDMFLDPEGKITIVVEAGIVHLV
jgi:hypothetical protein